MGDRRVLVVASPEFAAFGCDGVGSFASVQDAVDAVPLNNQVHTIIRIAPGVHQHRVHIPKTKSFITLCGSPIKDTVICWDSTATRIKHTQVVPLLAGLPLMNLRIEWIVYHVHAIPREIATVPGKNSLDKGCYLLDM